MIDELRHKTRALIRLPIETFTLFEIKFLTNAIEYLLDESKAYKTTESRVRILGEIYDKYAMKGGK